MFVLLYFGIYDYRLIQQTVRIFGQNLNIGSDMDHMELEIVSILLLC